LFLREFVRERESVRERERERERWRERERERWRERIKKGSLVQRYTIKTQEVTCAVLPSNHLIGYG
jgi:hypothetical protein